MQKSFAWAVGCCLLFSCNSSTTGSTTKDTTAAAAAAPATPPQSEFADARYTDMGKKAMAQLSSGDITAWMDNFADTAVYSWSAGDSLVGKAAIANYWKDRRSKVIDSLQFVNDIWLPLKVNRPQKGPDVAGIWLLSWMEVHAKYKNGAKLGFWVHTDYHYNSADKIDRVVQYMDRAPINKALGH
jgi:hypothetical protein